MAVVKDRCATSVTFAGRVGFRQAVGDRVEAHLRDNGLRPTDLPAMYVKTAAVLAWWLVVYLLILLGGFSWPVNLGLCLLWALAIAGVGFNVMHDANHSGYSSRPAVNRLFGLTAELLGISGFRWRTKHNVWHHTYTNIAGLDDDVETYGTMRLSPHEAWKPWHRLQAAYFPLIYGLIGLDFILRDFLMIFFGRSDEHHVYPPLSARDKLVFWAGKLCFATITVGLPLLVFPWWQVVIGFFVVQLAAGFVLGLVFELAHIMEVADFPEPTGDLLRIDNEWAVHQVETSVDFAPRNRLLSWYVGGLNYQIEHHLLPRLCHLRYQGIAPIVRRTCEDYGIRYNCHETWHGALAAHVRALHRLGRRPQVAWPATRRERAASA